MSNGRDSTFRQFANDTQLGEAVETPIVCVAIKGDHNRMDKWINGIPHLILV